MAGRRKYPDLRFLFMRGLIEHERRQRSHHYLKSAAECTSRAIVSLELNEEPVKSVKQARRLEGIGGETCSRLTKLESERNFSSLRPLAGRFVSSSGGILVALLDATDEALYSGHSQDRAVLIPEDSVKWRARNLTEEQFLDDSQEGFCSAWWRLEVLIKRGHIRRRSLKKSPVLQLLPTGKEAALRLRESVGLSAPVPSVPAQTLSTVSQGTSSPAGSRKSYVTVSTPSSSSREVTGIDELQEDALYTNDTGKDGVVLLVDIHEMGGDRVGLGQLCQLIEQQGICYKTRRLQTGDYSWFWRSDGREVILPCLVERKRADDISRTLKEGRFWSQVNKMSAWKKRFSDRGIECSLQYILERKPEEYVVQCPDACQGVGRCGNPTLTQVKMAMADLKTHPELLVKETESLEITVILLASFTAELVERLKKGDFDNLLQQELSDFKETLAGQTISNRPHDQEIKNKNDLDDQSLLAAVIEKPTPETGIKTEHSMSDVDNHHIQTKPDPVAGLHLSKQKHVSEMSFEEELQFAIDQSKKDVTFTLNNGLSNTKNCDSDSSKVKINFSNASKQSDRDRFANSDEDFDADISKAVEISKHEACKDAKMSDNRRHKMTAIPDTLGHPLMQYHCSASSSVTYPSGRSPDKNTKVGNVYHPKINRKRSFASTSLSNSAVTSHSETFTCRTHVEDTKPKANASINFYNDCKLDKGVVFSNEPDPSIAYSERILPKYQHIGSNNIYRPVPEESFKINEPDKANTNTSSEDGCTQNLVNTDHLTTSKSCNDTPQTVNKTTDKIKLNFTPSQLYTETNIVSMPRSRTNSGKVYRMRLDKGHNRVVREINDRKCRSESVNYDAIRRQSSKGQVDKVKEVASIDESGKYSTEHLKESYEDGCRSDEDLFEDTVSTNHNISVFDETSSVTCKTNKVKISTDVFSTPRSALQIRSPSSDRSTPESLPELSRDDLAFPVNDIEEQDTVKRSNFEVLDKPGPSRVLNMEEHMCTENKEYCYDEVISRHESNKSPVKDRTKMALSKGKRYDSGYDSETRQESKIEEKIKMILSILPQVSRQQVEAALKRNNDNAEACVSTLLEEEVQTAEIVDLTDSQNI